MRVDVRQPAPWRRYYYLPSRHAAPTYARRARRSWIELSTLVGQWSRVERHDVAGHQGELAPLPAACEGPL